MIRTLTNSFAVLLILVVHQLSALNLSLNPGDNVQTAIDQVATSGGGIVTLKAGTYTITTTLKIKSNVTLQGEPNFVTILKCTNDINMIEASDSKGGLKNITIQNITILGVQTVNSGGIQITSSTTDNENIKLLNVRCYETGWGVHIKGCIGLIIEDCDFSRNGALTKEGFAHNCYIRRVTNGYVRRSKFNNSISANGINISYSENINVTDCQMIGNYFRGVRSAVSVGFLVHNCIIKDNGDIGILANSETGGFTTTNCDWQNNCVENNRIGLSGGASGVCQNNNSFRNVEKDYNVSGSVTQSGNTSNANNACTPNTCNGTITPSLIQAECYMTMQGIDTEVCSEGGLNVAYINNGDWASYENVDLTNAKSIEARVASKVSGGTIEVRIDSPTGTILGTIAIDNTGGFQNWVTNATNITTTTGMHTVYLIFKGGSGYLFNLNSFGFLKTAAIITSVASTQATQQLSLYPNPTTESVYLDESEGSTYEVYTTYNQLQTKGMVTNNHFLINLDGFTTGTYLLQVNNQHTVKSIKVIKQ